ncbi:MAG: hypothetical protein D6808_03380, partial [Candidatus Dadabacteria bacterium]
MIVKSREKAKIKSFVYLSLLSGLSLLFLLPAGMYGTETVPFKTASLFHLALHVICVVLSIHTTLKVVLKEENLGVWWLRPVFLLFFLVLTTLLVGYAVAPVTARDALIHHLAVPKWWAEAGRVHEIRWHDWSYYPMLIHLIYTFFLQEGTEWLCSIYSLSYLYLISALLCLIVSKGAKSRFLLPFAYLLPLTIPIMIRLSTEPMPDIPLAYFTGVAFYLLTVEPEDKNSLLRLSFWSGVALGISLSIKYNAIPAAGLLVLASISLNPRLSPAAAIKRVIILCTISFLIFSPWLIKNYSLTGNPLYPLFGKIFGTVDYSGGIYRGYFPIEKRIAAYGESWLEILALPVRMILYGRDNDPRYFDGVLSPLFLVLFISLIRLKSERKVFFGFLYSAAYTAIAIIRAGARIRYLSPIYLPVLFLTIEGFQRALEVVKERMGKALVLSSLLLQLALGGVYSFNRIVEKNIWGYILGRISKKEFLERNIPIYRKIEEINSILPKGSRLLLLYTG